MSVSIASAAILLLFFCIGWMFASGVKSQTVRLFDVFLYGPFLIWLAFWLQTNADSLRHIGLPIPMEIVVLVLLFMGSTTIAYNLRNWLIQRHVSTAYS